MLGESPKRNSGAAASIREALAALLGPHKVSDTVAVLASHSGDKWFASHAPDVVVFAEATADVAAVMRLANQQGIPVTTRGAGYGYVGGCVPQCGGIVLSTARMNRILEIAPADGVVVTQPGVITGDLQAAVRALGWEYPPDPASLKDCSIGGNIATNAGGPRCLKYGVTRSYVLGSRRAVHRLGGHAWDCHRGHAADHPQATGAGDAGGNFSRFSDGGRGRAGGFARRSLAIGVGNHRCIHACSGKATAR
jgi:FAD/FMN-containing dehydrogenase